MAQTFVGGNIFVYDVEEDRTSRFSDRESFLQWMAKRPGIVIPCHTCGALPVGTFQDGSWKYDCHITSGIPHGPTTSPRPLWLPGEETA